MTFSNIKLNFHTKRYAYDICILIGRKIILDNLNIFYCALCVILRISIYYETLVVKIEARHSIQGCTWDEEKAKTVGESIFRDPSALRCTGKHNISLLPPTLSVSVLRKRAQDIEHAPDDHSYVVRCGALMLMLITDREKMQNQISS